MTTTIEIGTAKALPGTIEEGKIIEGKINFILWNKIGKYNLELIPKMGASLFTFRPNLNKRFESCPFSLKRLLSADQVIISPGISFADLKITLLYFLFFSFVY